jgi:hypothetical protein
MDLISQIINNKEFEWSFIFNNPGQVRPLGDPKIILSQTSHRLMDSRLTIREYKGQFHIVCQLQLKMNDDEYMISFLNLHEYQQYCSSRGLSNILHIDNPYYNVEWIIPFDKQEWIQLQKRLKEIDIPLIYDTASGKTWTRVIWISNYFGDYFSIRYCSDDPKMIPLNIIMDELLNQALKHVSLAYYFEGKYKEFTL